MVISGQNCHGTSLALHSTTVYQCAVTQFTNSCFDNWPLDCPSMHGLITVGLLGSLRGIQQTSRPCRLEPCSASSSNVSSAGLRSVTTTRRMSLLSGLEENFQGSHSSNIRQCQSRLPSWCPIVRQPLCHSSKQAARIPHS